MRPAVALRDEEDASVVGQPAQSERAWAADPSIVVYAREDFRLRGRGVERHDPAILVVRRARHEHCARAFVRPLELKELHLAVARLRRAFSLRARRRLLLRLRARLLLRLSASLLLPRLLRLLFDLLRLLSGLLRARFDSALALCLARSVLLGARLHAQRDLCAL